MKGIIIMILLWVIPYITGAVELGFKDELENKEIIIFIVRFAIILGFLQLLKYYVGLGV
jgi:phage-related holin